MNTNTQLDKIDKVLSKISGKELKAFAHQYAATHEDFATALVENIGSQSVVTTRKWWRLALPMLICQDAEGKIIIAEKRFECMRDMFVHKSWNLWEVYKKFVKYVPKKDLPFVGETLFNDIKRMALLKEKPKEFAWLVAYVQGYMGLSAVVDKTIKEGIKQLIAEYPDKYYLKNYLGSLL